MQRHLHRVLERRPVRRELRCPRRPHVRRVLQRQVVLDRLALASSSAAACRRSAPQCPPSTGSSRRTPREQPVRRHPRRRHTDSTDIVCGRFVVVPFTATPFSHVWPFVIDGLVTPPDHQLDSRGRSRPSSCHQGTHSRWSSRVLQHREHRPDRPVQARRERSSSRSIRRSAAPAARSPGPAATRAATPSVACVRWFARPDWSRHSLTRPAASASTSGVRSRPQRQAGDARRGEVGPPRERRPSTRGSGSSPLGRRAPAPWSFASARAVPRRASRLASARSRPSCSGSRRPASGCRSVTSTDVVERRPVRRELRRPRRPHVRRVLQRQVVLDRLALAARQRLRVDDQLGDVPDPREVRLARANSRSADTPPSSAPTAPTSSADGSSSFRRPPRRSATSGRP